MAEAFSPAPALSSGMVRKPALVPPVNGTKTPARRAAPGSKAKAAFTLRLENQRHLKLRVACAMSYRSAQQIVTVALDQFLDTLQIGSASCRERLCHYVSISVFALPFQKIH